MYKCVAYLTLFGLKTRIPHLFFTQYNYSRIDLLSNKFYLEIWHYPLIRGAQV
jgi:hypothetical protein